MPRFIEFVLNHWFLWSLFFAILALLIWYEMRSQVGGVIRVNPQQMTDLLNHAHAAIIDLRSNDDFLAGHVLGAMNIPQADFKPEHKKLQKYKTKPIVLICNRGQQATKSGIMLKQQGFAKVYSLTGGISAWQTAQLPLVKGK